MPVKVVVLVVFCLFCGQEILSQSHKKVPNNKRRYKSIHISKRKARVVCPIFENSKYPYHSLGIKVGDPFAVTYKFYANKNFAIAVDIGSAASGLYYKYHKERFPVYVNADTLTTDQRITYVGHTVKNSWVAEGKLLYQHDASTLLQGLQWYIGAGWQFRKLKLNYEYFMDVSLHENIVSKFQVNSFTMGPVGAVGIEYAYFDLPLSAFMEVEVYSDIMEDPEWMRLQGGAGLRYVF